MSWFDIILLIIIGGFGLFGFWFGFIHTLGSLLGTVFGVYLASRFYEPFAEWLIRVTGWGENISKVIVFIIAFLIINRLVGFAFWIIDKVLSIITRLPFLNSLNHLLGLAFGLIEGVITIGISIYFIERYPLSERVMSWIAQSEIAPITTSFAVILIPLLPEAIKLLHSSVDYVSDRVLN